MASTVSLASSVADLLHSEHPRPETYQEKNGTETHQEKNGTELAAPQKLQTSEEKVGPDSHNVPIAQRRGLLAFLTVIPEFDDARNYLPAIKLVIVLIVAFAGTTGPMGTLIMLPAIDNVSADLGTSVSIVNVSVGIYLISLGIFPMWWSNFSEKHGRRSVYVVLFLWFFAFSVGCALAPSISSLIVLRLFAGMGASAVQACGAATVSDLYIQEERGTALGLFYLGPLLGPFLSPIMGGAVAEAWGWRATMWVMVIFCGINCASIVFLLPETLRRDDSMAQVRLRLKVQFEVNKDDDLVLPDENVLERIATNLSQNSSLRRMVLRDETAFDVVTPTLLRLTTNRSAYSRRIQELELSQAESATSVDQKKWPHVLYDYLVRPMHAVILLGYPPVALAICYSSIAFAGVYFFNITITNQYSRAPYNYSSIIVGLMYIPNSLTYIVASIYGGKWNDWLLRRFAQTHNGELRPESRISWNVVTAVVIYPPACMIFGWCLEYGEHWVTPLIGTALFGFASMLVIGINVTYLIDVLPGKGATGVALNNLVRQLLAATATFITEPLLRALGPGVLFSIFAGVITVAALCMLYLKRRGHLLRERYDITAYYAKL